MRINRKKEDEEVAIDMSPMIDMVFLLLIFFLVASTIIDEKEPVSVPDAGYAKVTDDTTGRFEITVKEDGTLYRGRTEVSLEELESILAEAIRTRGVDEDDELKILIRADKNVKYKVNEELMAVCAKAGAHDMIFSAFDN